MWIREDRVPTLEEVAWLTSPEGRSVTAEMQENPADTPAAIARWRARLMPEQVAAAWQQVVLRRAARSKFARAAEMLFDRVALEQASDEVVAAHKARRLAALPRVADLCCGIGGDALAMARECQVVALDWSAVRLEMTRHNAAVYGGTVETVRGDASFDRPEADAAHVDPDRRAEGARRHDLASGSPSLEELARIVAHYGQAAIKISPGADVSSLPFDAEVELISHRGECRQAVLWTGGLQQTYRRATVLPEGASLSAARGDDLSWPEARAPRAGDVLLEPDASVIRADLVGVLARRLGAAPVDPQIAWLVSDEEKTEGLATAFRVVDVSEWSLARARPWLASHDIGRLEIKTRGFAARPEEIQRRLRLRGARAGVLLLTRIGAEAVAILAERIASGQVGK